MNRFILFIILASSFLMVYSQRTTKVSATYTYYAPETMSVEEAKRVALDRAKIQAIADEFGTIVSQSTSTVITNINGESDTQFFALGGSDVKGEWIETIGEPEYEINYINNQLLVRCVVKGKAREIVSGGIEYIAKPLRNGTSLKFEAKDFKDGDDLYLFFETPIDGYIAAYLLDETTQTVYSILPYKKQSIPAVEVKANQEYVFFSREKAEKGYRQFVDEYTLSCETDKEFNTLYVLFSPTSIGKRNGFDSAIEDKPTNISFKDFKIWLSKSLSKDKNLQFQVTHITISK